MPELGGGGAMKDTKVMFRFYTIPEYVKEQDFLCDQHKKGWAFRRVYFPGLYIFSRCEGEDVVYQLDYNQEGRAEKQAYLRLFEDCGWEYIQDFFGYSYFRKPAAQMQGKEEIYCDDGSRLAMIERVFKGRMIPLLVLFFLVIIPQLVLHGSGMRSANQFFFGLFSGLFFVYIVIFIQFGLQYWNMRKRLR